MNECKPLVAGVHYLQPGGRGHQDGHAHQGRALQVDPTKSTLIAPGYARLRPKCDQPLSNFAFEFNLRRYMKEFEASHGTVTDMDEARLRGEQTSLNPLGMVEGLIGGARLLLNPKP